MNGFLIIGTPHGYDVPLGLVGDREAAVEFAQDVTPSEVTDALRAVWSESSHPLPSSLKPIGVVLCEIRDCEPRPFEPVKNFDEGSQP